MWGIEHVRFLKGSSMENFTIGQRIAITFAIVFAILMALALIGYLTGGWDEAQGKEVNLYRGIEVDEKLLQLDKQALDEAYHNHLIRLWNVWLTDGARGADRITTGLRIARDSYHQASTQIAKREQEQRK